MNPKRNPIGVMQGRLLPPEDGRIQAFPRTRYAEEFALARSAGLDGIEWIAESYGADENPLLRDGGVGELRELSERTGVRVLSICADIFMEHPIAPPDPADFDASAHLRMLLARAGEIGAGHVVLPFVDRSSLRRSTLGDLDRVVAFLESLAPDAERASVGLHLELDLPPPDARSLLDRLPHPLIRVTWDVGNSASLGYDTREELDAFGNRVGSVHVKDRVLGGSTVPLGEGDVDFDVVFGDLAARGYGGPFILQVARGETGKEVEWARSNRDFVERFLPTHGS